MRLVIVGACGRMGEAIARLALAREDVQIVGAVDTRGCGESLGRRIGNPELAVTVTDQLEATLQNAEVMIDFSTPEGTVSNLAACARAGVAAVVGTTGQEDRFAEQLEPLAAHIPILIAANTSLGVTVLSELVRAAARALPEQFDIEIHEAHHRDKLDAPSGTALKLGEAAAQGRGQTLQALRAEPYASGHRRSRGTIGFAVSRGGDVVGEHVVRFTGLGESLTLGHYATDRAIFARGALEAAAWLRGRPAGRYDMRDVLGIKSV